MSEQNEVVAQPEQSGQGVQTAESPAVGADQGQQPSQPGASSPGQSQVPFNKSPEFQSFLERQQKMWDRDWNRKLEKIQSDNDRRFSEMQSQFQQQSTRSNQPITEQDRSQLRQLAQLMIQDPEVAKMFGMEDLRSLKDEFGNFRASSNQDSVESGLNEVSKKYASDYGYNQMELKNELIDYMQTDEYWREQPQTRQTVAKAARDYFSDRSQELAERTANMKLVTENQSKMKAGIKKPSAQTPPTGPVTAPRSMREAISQSMDRMKAEGISF